MMAWKRNIDYDLAAKKAGFSSKDEYSKSLGYGSHAEHIGFTTTQPTSFTRQGDAIALRDRKVSRPATVNGAVSKALGFKIK